MSIPNPYTYAYSYETAHAERTARVRHAERYGHMYSQLRRQRGQSSPGGGS